MKLNMRWAPVIGAVVGIGIGAGAAGVAQSGGGLGPADFEPRSIDGTGNNLANDGWGSVGAQLMRLTSSWYADGMNEPAGADRPGPREISNAVCAQSELIFNNGNASDIIWQWGQFLDHDITLVDLDQPLDPFNIPVPLGDPFFDPDGTGTQVIPLDRSAFDPDTGLEIENPRQQIEFITAYIDGSQVYGSDQLRADTLRANDGTGRLATSDGNLLPFNTTGLPNAGGPGADLFVAGDIRANEHVGLISMHTLWMREHNRIADIINEAAPSLDGDTVYERARAIVGAELQIITYNEFLPLLIGPDAIPVYEGYDPDVNAGIANVFASAAYRVGHTLLSPMINRIDANGDEIPEGHLALRDAFFAVSRITDEGGISPILRGLASKLAQDVDVRIIDDVRNFLFGPPGAGGFDLAALNLQRGREHGLPSYNRTRIEFGLAAMTDFTDITSDPEISDGLASVYATVDDIDLWIGALAEDHMPGAMVGELIQAIVGDQFRRLRDGDRFYYKVQFGPVMQWFLESVQLSDVIKWNTDIADELATDVFRVEPATCAGDITGDGTVVVADILDVLVAWGEVGGPADLDGSGTVGLGDLIFVINAYGPCEVPAAAAPHEALLIDGLREWLDASPTLEVRRR